MKSKVVLSVGIVIAIILVVSIGTYAWLNWSSTNTNITATVPEILFENGSSDINVSNMGPVLSYEKGEMTSFSIGNYASTSVNYSVSLNITSISANLKNANFKYILQSSSTNGSGYTNIATGNFGSIPSDNIVKILNTTSLASGKKYYRFILYIDGTVSNNTNMMGNSLKGRLDVNVVK